MSQHDLNIANQGFPAFRADLNDALVALGSTNSGATAPATTFANQLWYDTANNILKIRNEDNDAWISIATLDQSGDVISAITAATVNAGALNTTGNTVLGDASTDTLNVGNGGLIKDASGNVGIGVSPTQKLDIASKVQIVTSNSFGKINLARATDSSIGALYIQGGDIAGTSNDLSLVNGGGGGAALNVTGGDIRLYTGGTTTERLRLNDTGALVLQGGTVTANGIGITFPSTQSPSSNANTLDDYEEGTWTPVITPSGGSLTAYSSEGRYVKIGQSLILFGAFTITTTGTASGFAGVAGMPFTSMSSSISNRAAIGLARENAATGNTFQIYINAGATTGDILTLTNGAITWNSGFTYIFTLAYITSA
jgi:hypothetical protein